MPRLVAESNIKLINGDLIVDDKNTPSFNNLTNLYSVSKTLRFELKPQFSTLEHIKDNKIIQKGEELKSHYEIFKKILDQVFIKLIDDSLDHTYFDLKLIEQFKDLKFKPREQFTEKDATNLRNLKDVMKKQIDKNLDNPEKKSIFKDPANFLLDNANQYLEIVDSQQQSIEAFKRQKGYLSGYLQNRQNIFDRTTNETSVAFRIVEDNLPIFLNNQMILSRFLNTIADKDTLLIQIKSAIEKLGANINFETFFELDYFNRTLSQSGIEKYNLLISGKTTDQNTKLKGINELIKEYIDQHQGEKLKKIKLKKLYKQILSESTTSSFAFDIIDTNEDLMEMIGNFLQLTYERVKEKIPFLEKIESLKDYNQNSTIDLSQVYIERRSLKRLSSCVFKEFDFIEQKLEENFVAQFSGKLTKKALDSYRKKQNLSLQEVYDGLQDIQYELNGNNVPAQDLFFSGIPDFIYHGLDCHLQNLLEKVQSENLLFQEISQLQSKNIEQNSFNHPTFNQKSISGIKEILDFYKTFQVNLSLFNMNREDGKVELDPEFYSDFDEFYSDLREIIPVYNKARNYLTKKPFSTEKTKLTFDNSYLLNGWSKRKEKNCFGTIFKKNQKYYIGVINSQTKVKDNLFESYNFPELLQDQDCYEKMNLYFLSDLKRDFPKKYFSEKWDKRYSIPAELRKKYEYYRQDENKDEQKADLAYHHELIAYYQNCLSKDEEWQVYNFKLKDPKSYVNVSDFLADLTPNTYRMDFTKIPESYIKKLADDGKLYFFQLYSKDFSENSKGKPNLHTLYLKAVFDQINAEKFNYSYKISGEAEIFYRPASLGYKVTHEKNKPIQNKNKNNHKKESVFSYDLLKNRRYMMDKFFLHLPIELNRTPLHSKDSVINQEVNQIVKLRPKNYFLGVDRGERHLIYLVLIDEDGKIIKQQTLNQISNQYKNQNGETETVTTNYHDLLDAKEKQRKESLQEWQTVENIKELKAGFLSNVVNEIGKIITEYQPVIMLENLNTGFKNSRIKIEKQVYQKFEKALIDKFNYFIRKDLDPESVGGLYHTLQLTKGYSKQYNGKQNGIVYYIPANYTSNIDPTTGFISSFIPTRYESVEKTKDLISKFNSISYDEQEDLFCFEIDYRKIRPDTKLWERKVWQIYTYGDRFDTYRDKNGQWISDPVKPNEKFKQLFNEYDINLGQDLKQQILSQNDADFFRQFLRLLKLTLQMRNSKTATGEQDIQSSIRDNDYIISPVKNSRGVFYDSRRDYKDWPENADANGAYNIARKGLIMLKNLKGGVDEKRICDISTENWLKFVEGISEGD